MAVWLREYSYRKIFGLSHEEYDREPLGVIEWMIRIEALHEKVHAKQMKRQNQGGQQYGPAGGA